MLVQLLLHVGSPGPTADQEQQAAQQQWSAQGLQKLAEQLLLDGQMQHDGQAAAAVAQACCCCCHQTRTLPVAPSAWGCEAQNLLLLQMVCEHLLLMSKLMKHKQLHKHKVEVNRHDGLLDC